MRWVFFWTGLAFATQMWLVLRIARANRGLAVASFVFLPVAAIAYFKLRDDPDTNITVPLIATALCTALLITSGVKLAGRGAERLQAEMEDAVGADADDPSDAAPTGATDPAPTAVSATAAEPFDALSAAFSAAAIRHTMTRADATAKLPPGVREAALIAAWPVGTDAASPNPAELTATVYRCDSVRVCGALAGGAMRSAVVPRPRVLQNGSLVLTIPAAAPGDSGQLQSALAEAFRRGTY